MAFLRRIWNKWQNLLHDEKLKHKIYVIIFESDTPMGKLFDVALIGFIVLSILVVIAESIKSWDTVIGLPDLDRRGLLRENRRLGKKSESLVL